MLNNSGMPFQLTKGRGYDAGESIFEFVALNLRGVSGSEVPKSNTNEVRLTLFRKNDLLELVDIDSSLKPFPVIFRLIIVVAARSLFQIRV